MLNTLCSWRHFCPNWSSPFLTVDQYKNDRFLRKSWKWNCSSRLVENCIRKGPISQQINQSINQWSVSQQASQSFLFVLLFSFTRANNFPQAAVINILCTSPGYCPMMYSLSFLWHLKYLVTIGPLVLEGSWLVIIFVFLKISQLEAGMLSRM